MEGLLRITLCGGLRIERDGVGIDRLIPGRQARELFAYLMVNRGRPTTRDELVEVLWPGKVPRSPEAGLNTVLARVRRVLGREALIGRKQLSLALPKGTWVDLDEAREGADRARSLLREGLGLEAATVAAEAAALVSPPLLPEIEQIWVQIHREESEELARDLLDIGARAALRAGGAEVIEAERAARRLIRRQPFRESGYALLMQAHAAHGDVAEALVVYDRLRKLLRDELGTSPSSEIGALHQELLSGQLQAIRPEGARSSAWPLPRILERHCRRPLRGRTRGSRALAEQWRAIATEGLRVTAINGEPGIGKTMLVAHHAKACRDAGAAVLYGRAEQQALAPYPPLVEALRQYVGAVGVEHVQRALAVHLDELRWLIPELAVRSVPEADRRASPPAATGEERDRRWRVFQAMEAVLEDATEHGPLLLVLEDLHWSDAGTVLLVRQLLRDLGSRPVQVLLTYRAEGIADSHPLSVLVADAEREHEAARIKLDGLGDEDIASLVRDADRRPGDGLAAELRERTAGNPLFVVELIHSLDVATPADTPLPADAVQRLGVPERVQDAIVRRVAGLDDDVRDVLAMCAVLGREFELAVIEAVLGDGDAIVEALDVAQDAALIVSDSDCSERLAFRHTLIHESTYLSLSRARRARLHRRAALALEPRAGALSVPASELARHFLHAATPELAPQAIEHCARAGERAMQSCAYEEAADDYRRALDVVDRHLDQDDARRCELLLALGEVCWRASLPEARQAFERAIEVARRSGAPAQLARAALGLGGRFYAPNGVDERYVELLEEALTALDDTETSLRARLLARLAENVLSVDEARAQRLSAAAVESAERVGDDGLICGTLLSRHAALLSVERLDERLELGHRMVALARNQGQSELEALGHHWRLYDLLEAGQMPAAKEEHGRLTALASELRQPLHLHSALTWESVLHQLAGRFSAAEESARRAVRLAIAAGTAEALENHCAQLVCIRRDAGGLAGLVDQVAALARGGRAFWTALHALVRLDGGDAVGAGELLRGGPVSRPGELPRGVFWLPTAAVLGEVAAATEDSALAESLLELLTPHAERFVQVTFNGSLGSLHRPLGLLAGAVGSPALAREHFEAALDAHRRIGAPALEARTCRDYAAALDAGRAHGQRRLIELLQARAAALAGRAAVGERLSAS